MTSTASISKNQLRQIMKKRLASMNLLDYQRLNSGLKKSFLELLRVEQASVIMMYYSIRNEVETVSIIEEMLARGKTVGLPICTADNDLKVGSIKTLTNLVSAKFGLKEPAPQAPLICPADLNLVIVPGVAFDKRGYRLGHGAGYYDRFLSKLGSVYKLGIAYDFQVVNELIVESFDIPVDGLLTPSGYREFTDKQILGKIIGN